MKSKYQIILIIIVAAFGSSSLFSASSPKRDFRAVWIATVKNYDWPTSTSIPPEQQKKNLVAMFDNMKQAGYNAIIFQVRPECDALYNSSIEPWSYWLTGVQGKSVPYDPLGFAIQEAHKRGMELHAWFNPYRTASLIGRYPAAQNHISVTKPEWNLTVSTVKMLDPGLQEVRNYVSTVIADVVRRYDIDGIHFDDYFYPYEIITTQDNATFAKYPRGFTDQGEWRRDNVNIFVKQVHDTVTAIKPYVKYGISPFGIWKNGVPSGITGLDAYASIYCDALAWVKQNTVDYLMPQLYWGFGGGQDYAKLEQWWADSIKIPNSTCHFYPGLGLYRLEDNSLTSAVIAQQVRFSRNNPKTDGTVHFRALMVQNNQQKIFDTLTNDLYKNRAIPSVMSWKDKVPPNAPRNLRLEVQPSTNLGILKWDVPTSAADGDTAVRYAVYRVSGTTITPADVDNSSNIYSIVGEREIIVLPPPQAGYSSFTVTSLDRNNNESVMSAVVGGVLVPLAAVAIITPPNGGSIGRAGDLFRWRSVPNATSYSMQFSASAGFEPAAIFVSTATGDTSFTFTSNVIGQTMYYWRVAANVSGGMGPFSAINNFVTGWPTSVTMLQPASATLNVALKPAFIWSKNSAASSYRLQVAKPPVFDSTTIVADTIIVNDTTHILRNPLLENFIYRWRVQPINAFGFGSWPAAQYYAFKTLTPAGVCLVEQIPLTNELKQNYPNPFNPSTQFEFSILKQSNVRLAIYDLLGKEIETVVDQELSAGSYRVSWNAAHCASGVYFYSLKTDAFSDMKKMLLTR